MLAATKYYNESKNMAAAQFNLRISDFSFNLVVQKVLPYLCKRTAALRRQKEETIEISL